MSLSPSSTKGAQPPPLFKFGLIADVQHAPIPDGASFSGEPRYYRHALSVCESASKHFQNAECDFAINLGDIIDGQAANVPGGPLSVLRSISSSLSSFTSPVYHTYGNHEMYCFDRPTLSAELGLPFVTEPTGDLVAYYSVVRGDYRFVFLDNYDETVLSRNGGKKTAADKLLNSKNPNYASGSANHPYPDSPTSLNRRFVSFNGGLGDLQLSWLTTELEASRTLHQSVIISSHQPIHPSTTPPICLPYNYLPLLSLVHSYSDVVTLTLSGHTHKSGYVEDGGVAFLVVPAVLESGPPVETYGILEVYEDRIEVRGEGEFESRTVFTKGTKGGRG